MDFEKEEQGLSLHVEDVDDGAASTKTSSSSIKSTQSSESGVFFDDDANPVVVNVEAKKRNKLRRQTGTINIEDIRTLTTSTIPEEGVDDVTKDDSLLHNSPPPLVKAGASKVSLPLDDQLLTCSTPSKENSTSVPDLTSVSMPVTPMAPIPMPPVSGSLTLNRKLNKSSREKSNRLDTSCNMSDASFLSVKSSKSFIDRSASWLVSAAYDLVRSPRRKRKETKRKKQTSSKNGSILSNIDQNIPDLCVNDSLVLKDDQDSFIPRSKTVSLIRRSLSNMAEDGLASDLAEDSTISTVKVEDLAKTFTPKQARFGSSGALNDRSSPSAMAPEGYFTIDSRRLASKHSRRNLVDRKLMQCVKQFNLDPKIGIEMLGENGIVDPSNPEEIAVFLFREGRLSKKQIGAYIGSHHEFNQKVLSCFVKKHEFMNLILVQALRQFLWSFRLPGEAMQIDRIMESFASHYCAQNPELFEETDTCYIISFSIIMLNTALHNPNVRHKITLEQFIKQNRGINSGNDLPVEILEQIYRSIKEEPFRIPDENYDDLMYTFFSPEKEGWLLKEGGSWKSWKRRWFVLSDRCLYYFQHTTENVPKGIVPLENVKVRKIPDCDGKTFCFEVFCENSAHVKGCKTDSHGTVVQGNHRSYKMSASSEVERSTWVELIQNSIKEHPFYDIISSKKAALRRKSLRHGQQHDIPSSSSVI